MKRILNKTFVKALIVVILIVILLVEFNYAFGIDFRLRRKLRSWNENVEIPAYCCYRRGNDNLENFPQQIVSLLGYESVDMGGRTIHFYHRCVVSIEGDDIFFVNYMYGRDYYQLMSYNASEKTFRLHYEKAFSSHPGNYIVAEGLRPGYQDPYQSYSGYFPEGNTAVCMRSYDEIILQNGHEAVVFNIRTEELTEKEGIYCPQEMYSGLSITDKDITVALGNGETRTLTLQDMAQLDKTAKELYAMSLHRTAIFGPKVKVEFSRTGYYGDGVFIALVVSDSGGWAHLVYYLYQPESDTLSFLHWEDILDPAERYESHIIPQSIYE